MSNTFKHSFINSGTHNFNLYGADAPTVNMYDTKSSVKGMKSTEPVFRSYFLHEIIDWYGSFFFHARDGAKAIQKQLWKNMKNLHK